MKSPALRTALLGLSLAAAPACVATQKIKTAEQTRAAVEQNSSAERPISDAEALAMAEQYLIKQSVRIHPSLNRTTALRAIALTLLLIRAFEEVT